MKKLLAFTLAGVMMFSMPVLAANSPTASSCRPKPSASTEACAPMAAASVPAIEATSVEAAVMDAAAAEGKTVGEYMNNVVVTVPGLENVMPVGQGGHVIINGAPSNQTFTVLKPTQANVRSAKAYAAALGGKVLNVVQVSASVKNFKTARVNFYTKGVTAGQNIMVIQMVNGRWSEIDVVEIREDHVVVDMTSLGTLAFLEIF